MDKIKRLNKYSKYIILFLAFVGILLCIELCIIYYKVNFTVNYMPSFCTINSQIDCDGVARTSYSHLLGIPLSLYGLGFYCFVFFLGLLPKSIIAKPKSIIYTFSIFSVIMSLSLWFISSFVIHKICILCYITYFINFLIFIFSKLGESSMQHFKNAFNDVKTVLSNKLYRIIILIAIIIGLSVFVIVNWYHVFVPQSNDTATYKASADTQYENVLGQKGAKLVIREYTDFQCPYCAVSDSMLHKLVKEQKNVEIIHYNYPLSGQCNKYIQGEGHPYACKAALYSIAAEKQNKMVQFNSLLFENQQKLDEDRILELAKSINLNVDKLKKDAYSPDVRQELESEIEAGASSGITGTPTYFIGIKKYDGYIPYDQMKALINSDLNR